MGVGKILVLISLSARWPFHEPRVRLTNACHRRYRGKTIAESDGSCNNIQPVFNHHTPKDTEPGLYGRTASLSDISAIPSALVLRISVNI